MLQYENYNLRKKKTDDLDFIRIKDFSFEKNTVNEKTSHKLGGSICKTYLINDLHPKYTRTCRIWNEQPNFKTGKICEKTPHQRISTHGKYLY